MARTIKTGLIEISKKASMGQFDGYIRSSLFCTYQHPMREQLSEKYMFAIT